MITGETGRLGKAYRVGEEIIRQGELGECMYIIQLGEAEMVRREGEKELCLGVLKAGDFFGEMALFEKELRSVTVRALSDVWALTLERKEFLRRLHEDSSLAFSIMEKLCRRIQKLNQMLIRTSESAAASASS